MVIGPCVDFLFVMKLKAGLEYPAQDLMWISYLAYGLSLVACLRSSCHGPAEDLHRSTLDVQHHGCSILLEGRGGVGG